MKKFFNPQKEVSIQSLSGYIPAPEYMKNRLLQKYKRDIALIAVWITGLAVCLLYYLFLLISNNQGKRVIIGLFFFLVLFLGAGIWRIIERQRVLNKVNEATIKKVKIHHLTKGVHLFSAEAKITEDDENVVSYIFYLNKKNLKKYKTDPDTKWWLVKINESALELLPIDK